jgi:hypothetical protein
MFPGCLLNKENNSSCAHIPVVAFQHEQTGKMPEVANGSCLLAMGILYKAGAMHRPVDEVVDEGGQESTVQMTTVVISPGAQLVLTV